MAQPAQIGSKDLTQVGAPPFLPPEAKQSVDHWTRRRQANKN